VGALQQFGYEDKKTGRIEKLPLQTNTYDPAAEALKLYGNGINIVVWNYSHDRGNWGKPFPWKPEDKKKRVLKSAKPKPTPQSKQKPKENPKAKAERSIKDLSASEKEILTKMFVKDATNDEIIEVFGLKHSAVYNAKHSWKKNSAKEQKTEPRETEPQKTAIIEEIPDKIDLINPDALSDNLDNLMEKMYERRLLMNAYTDRILSLQSSNRMDARMLRKYLGDLLKLEEI
jgi:hypothetical protein